MNQFILTRRALTLAETLIAMGILSIGLLGVAAVFPVGGFYVESGDIADQGGAVAQAALDDAVIRGHLDPENWVVHDVNGITRNPQTSSFGQEAGTASNRFARLISGEPLFRPAPNAPLIRKLGLRDAVRLSVAPGDNPGIVANVNALTNNGANPVLFRTAFYGGAFIIDPIGLAGALADINSDSELVQGVSTSNFGFTSVVRNFPAFVNDEELTSPAWGPWTFPRPTGSPIAGLLWPVRRVTTVHDLTAINTPPGNGSRSWATLDATAREFFGSSDDLAQFFPARGDEPVRQRWELASSGGAPLPSIRQSRGEYSWLISVAPGSAEAVDSLATDPGSHPVEVSAVVFHRRTAVRGPQAAVEAERLVRARVVSTSTGGGELLLVRRPANPPDPDRPTEPQASPFTALRPGEFIMLTGPHPQSTLQNPQYAVRWCRVLNIQDSGTVTAPSIGTQQLDGEERVLVALRGPDWPWQAATATDQSLLANDLRVAVLPGAVAVHTKTMRLESGSEWSID